MEQKPKSEGSCIYWGKIFTKTGIYRHLKVYLHEKAIENKEGKSYLVQIETKSGCGSNPYFLSLWIDGATMNDTDSFLRDIWMECCGHMSAFRKPQLKQKRRGMWEYFEAMSLLETGKKKQYETMMEDMNGELPMSRKINKVFYNDLKLEFTYDFGDSTVLILKILEQYPVKADKKIVLLSRNEPLAWICDSDEKEPVKHLCIAHDCGEGCMFCDSCAKKHAKTCDVFDNYIDLQIVNSIRMGICGYNGGVINVGRDWKM